MLLYKAVFAGFLLWAFYLPVSFAYVPVSFVYGLVSSAAYVPVSFAEEQASFALEDIPSDKEELKVQESFPLYRVDFSHKLVQEEVHEELLKERKEKEEQSQLSPPE